jgi:uncharacterized membrane protein
MTTSKGQPVPIGSDRPWRILGDRPLVLVLVLALVLMLVLVLVLYWC